MFRKLSLATGLGSSSGPGKDGKHQAGFQGKVVKYTPYSARHLRDDDDLDEVITVISRRSMCRYAPGRECTTRYLDT